MTAAEVELGNGKNGAPLYTTMNGKVRELTFAQGSKEWDDQVKFLEVFGHYGELALSKNFYDPKYGNPQRLEDFTREHAAYLEDMQYNMVRNTTGVGTWKVIAHFGQQYRD